MTNGPTPTPPPRNEGEYARKLALAILSTLEKKGLLTSLDVDTILHVAHRSAQAPDSAPAPAPAAVDEAPPAPAAPAGEAAPAPAAPVEDVVPPAPAAEDAAPAAPATPTIPAR